MNIINLTPYRITAAGASFPPDGRVARVKKPIVGDVNGIPVVEMRSAIVEGLPAPQPDTVFVVDRRVAEVAVGRDDLLIPGKAARDERGRVVGLENFARISR